MSRIKENAAYLWGSLAVLFVVCSFFSGWWIIKEQNDAIARDTHITICLTMAHQQVLLSALEVQVTGRLPSLVPICGATAEQIIREVELRGLSGGPQIRK